MEGQRGGTTSACSNIVPGLDRLCGRGRHTSSPRVDKNASVPRLLIVHHSPSPTTRLIADAVIDGSRADGIEGVDVDVVAALEATSAQACAADGYLLGTTANLGYMSGAMKHFFDTVYNDLLGVGRGRPYGLWVRGESDTGGAMLGVEKIATGLEWRAAQQPLSLIGAVGDDELRRAYELGASVAAGLMA